jgi:glucokinase
MILAGDVGGTKTILGLFENAEGRPRAIAVSVFRTLDHDSLPGFVAAFLVETGVSMDAVSAACFGVAGPVSGGRARLTNVPWSIDTRDFVDGFGWSRVMLLNDLEAMACAIPVLLESELHVLQRGEPRLDGHMALIAAGTGLGEAFLHNVNGRLIPAASEGGHADWAARGEGDIQVLCSLRQRYGRVEVEQVVSGRGLLNLHRVMHATPCHVVTGDDDRCTPAAITAAAFDRRCGGCMETLNVFVDAFGAEAGNLALRTLATAGVFVGGGIAPKILPALTDGRFMRAFVDKAPFTQLLERIPVKVILNDQAGLLGAGVRALQEGTGWARRSAP